MATFISQIKFDVVSRKKPELLAKLRSLLGDAHLEETPESYDKAVTAFLERKLHQETVSGNLWYMLNHFSDHPSSELPDDLMPMHLVGSIIGKKEEIYRNIEKKCK